VAQATSTFTFRALFRALKWLEPRQTALLRGRHGIGKSAVAYQMAEIWGLDTVIERRISQLSEGDMIGLPDRGAVRVFDGVEWLVTSFLPTDWFLEAQHKPCLVFLDEINRGTPETMQACFQFVEKGELNGRKVHPDTRIIAAVNFSKEYNITPMDPAFVDRFWVADVEPDKEDWLAWARGKGNIHAKIIEFISQCNEDHFEILPEQISKLPTTEVIPSRRSWERLARHVVRVVSGEMLINTPTAGVFYDVCRGFVGPDAARALVKFLRSCEDNITPSDILNNFKKVEKTILSLSAEQQMSIIDKVKHFLHSTNVRMTEEQAKNMSDFMKVLPPEIGLTIWNVISNTCTENASLFHKQCAQYSLKTITKMKK
jgi:hypothetical protein